jgi:hypothetical protein
MTCWLRCFWDARRAGRLIHGLLVVEQLAAQGADHALADRVRPSARGGLLPIRSPQEPESADQFAKRMKGQG